MHGRTDILFLDDKGDCVHTCRKMLDVDIVFRKDLQCTIDKANFLTHSSFVKSERNKSLLTSNTCNWSKASRISFDDGTFIFRFIGI